MYIGGNLTMENAVADSVAVKASRWNLVAYIIDRFGLAGTPAAVAVVFGGILLCIISAYLLGSLNFGVMISQKQFHDDVRTHGSGNAGTTNMLRTYGPRAAVLTLLGDMLKAAAAVGLGYLIFNGQVEYMENGELVRVIGDKPGAAVSGLFVVLGHMFPCFFRFKGGKGVATAAMVALMVNPWVFLILVGIFAVIVGFTRFVSLGSVMGVCLYPILLSGFEAQKGSYSVTAAAVIIAVLVTYMHRENLKRLWHGEESKLTFRKKDAPVVTDPSELTGKAKKAAQKQAHEEQKRIDAELAAQQAEDDKVWTEDKFVTCVGCGRIIPRSRKVCIYCNTVNTRYAPDPDEQPADGKKKKKSKK